jgi:hypothetical protein
MTEFRDFTHFCEWYMGLQDADDFCKVEAMTIYFNLPIYLGDDQ